MQELIHELEYLMACELEIYVGLLQYAKQKKTALIGNDLDELSMLVKLEDEELCRLGDISGRRESLFDRIAQENAYAGKVTFDYIVKDLSIEERGELDHIRERYQEVIRELSELNDLNQNLLQMQLQYTSFQMDILMQAKPVGGTYASTGHINTEVHSGRRFIDQEA